MNRGNYYRLRAKKWLESLGYDVAIAEQSRRIFARGKIIFQRSDLWGADLIAKNSEEIIFIQVKSNPAHIAQGIRQLSGTAWPSTVRRWVLAWAPRAREPMIIDVDETLQK